MKHIKTAVMATVTSSVLLLTGCGTTNGFNNMSNTAKGATAGAITGALIKSGGNREDIATGALAGAAIGGAGGYIYDETQKND